MTLQITNQSTLRKSPKRADTAKAVDTALRSHTPSTYCAGNGLYLRVTGSGYGSWILRYQMNGKRRLMGLGSTRAFTLAEARELAQDALRLAARGTDPIDERRSIQQRDQGQKITFDQVAAEYIESMRPQWTNPKHAQQWSNTLATYASPVIGRMAPALITTEHLLQILKPIWLTKSETASRLRQRIECVFDFAKAKKLVTGNNPAEWKGNLKILLPDQKLISKVEHHPALSWQQAPAFWAALIQRESISALTLQLMILTCVRTQEVIGAEWKEFDLKKRIWTIPSDRMKRKKEHTVPLSDAAMDLLEQIPKVKSGWLFEGQQPGTYQSTNTLRSLIQRHMHSEQKRLDGRGWLAADGSGKLIVPHGFRSTFRDWASETTTAQETVIEMALSHAISNKVEAAYRRGELLDKRRSLMQEWAAYLTETPKSSA